MTSPAQHDNHGASAGGVPSAIRPWVGYNIDRFGDTAVVTIRWIWFEADKSCTKRVEQYETLSRGATASARKMADYVRANFIGADDRVLVAAETAGGVA